MSKEDLKYRHELKYVISLSQLSVLKKRIENIMFPDKHVNSDGTYTIRSLYFDDYYNSCFYENENGTDPREKFRIRIYNNSCERISLECKRKERGKTLKTMCPLTKEQTESFIQDDFPMMIDREHPLFNKAIIHMRSRLLRPKVIVEYERMPFVYKEGNVRVTFDTNISSSSNVQSFLDCGPIEKRPIMPKGQHLMEVKFDEFLPDFIYKSLDLNMLQQTAYSKYYLSRRYTIYG